MQLKENVVADCVTVFICLLAKIFQTDFNETQKIITPL